PVQALANAPAKAMPALRRPRAVRPAALARAARMPADPRRQATVRTNRRAASSKTAVRSKHLLARRRSRRASRLAFQRVTIGARFARGQTAASPSSVCRPQYMGRYSPNGGGRRNPTDARAVAGALAARAAGYVALLVPLLGAWLSFLPAAAAPMRQPF